LDEDEAAARGLLVAHRDSANALASRLGAPLDWQETLAVAASAGAATPSAVALAPEVAATHALLAAFPDTVELLARLRLNE